MNMSESVAAPAPTSGAVSRLSGLVRAAIHVCVWSALVALPLVTSPFPRMTAGHILPGMAALAAVFYLNYLLLVPRLLLRKKLTWAWFAANLALFVGMQFIIGRPEPGFIPSSPHRPPAWEENIPPVGMPFPRKPTMAFAFLPGLLLMAISAGGAAALRLYSGLIEESRLRRELETEFLRHELTYLRLQLGPHFLFNTLNNIYSLIQTKASAAQAAVMDLSRMLRYQLYEAQATVVPLAAEIDFLRSYVALMELRLPAHAAVDLCIHDDLKGGLQVAPLLWLPLVENAFKHGIHPTRSGVIAIDLSRDGEQLRLKVTNPNHARPDSNRTGSGIGIANLRKRLGLQEEGSHRLEIESGPDLYSAILWIRILREQA
jgi:Histidine kinase